VHVGSIKLNASQFECAVASGFMRADNRRLFACTRER